MRQILHLPVLAHALTLLALPSAAVLHAQGAAPEPRVFAVRAAELQHARARVQQGDSLLRPALDRLVAQADEALAMRPVSVVQKRRLPPSGDRHDYMSMGPYWWPDPARPDGLPYIRRDGERNPESREDFDSSRWNAMSEAAWTLALAYHFTGREEYARQAARLLRVWFLDPATRMNPNLRFGQSIPGRTEGRGIGIIDTREIPKLVDAIGLLQRSPAWTAAHQDGMERWFAGYLDWLLTSDLGVDEQHEHNNHGTWYDAQTLAMALFLDREELAREIAEQAKLRRIDAHINARGEQPHELERTRSLSYSTMNLEGMAQIAEMARHAGVDLWGYRGPGGGSIRAALDYLAPYADPAARWPHPQIQPVSPGALLLHLRRGALVYRDPRYRTAAERVPPEHLRGDPALLLYPR